MEIAARAALPQERGAIRQLYEQAMRNHIETIWGWDQLWQDNDFDSTFQSSLTYVIESDSTLLGYFQVDQNENHDYLRMLILKPTARSTGIGAKILSRILEIAHDNGKTLMLRVFKLNVDAKRFYEREGWMVLAEEDAFFLMGHSSNPVANQPNKSFRRAAKSYAFVVR
ncbi:MAG TPA: GNAT family N-acetyltransferase [Thiobacillus sp.]|nr:GNAT family N-acetyltransferase [Thiobacillus sp.]